MATKSAWNVVCGAGVCGSFRGRFQQEPEARMADPDPFDLQRFIDAQDPVFQTVTAEL